MAGRGGGASAGSSTAAGMGNTLGGEGGGSATTGPLSEQLTLCNRLTEVPTKERDFSDAFERLVYLDCRVAWLPQLYLKPVNVRFQYQNALERWNLRFWGCDGVPVTDFQLVWQEPPLSRGDADIVIDHYLQAATEFLELSPKEQEDMRAALQRLSTPAVTSDSLEPSQSSCETGGAGGAGGEGGAGEGPSLGGAGATSAGTAGEAAASGSNVGGAP
jgi:hypothetical protein